MKLTNLTDETLSTGQVLSPYLAFAYAEGVCEGEGACYQDQLKAWAYLIRTGQCWIMQGFYGRNASHLIEIGVISPEGNINWNEVDEILEEA